MSLSGYGPGTPVSISLSLVPRLAPGRKGLGAFFLKVAA